MEPKESEKQAPTAPDLREPLSKEGWNFSHRDESGNLIWISGGDGDSQITTDESGHRVDEE